MVIKQVRVHYMVLSGFPKGSQYQFILLNGEGHCKSIIMFSPRTQYNEPGRYLNQGQSNQYSNYLVVTAIHKGVLIVKDLM